MRASPPLGLAVRAIPFAGSGPSKPFHPLGVAVESISLLACETPHCLGVQLPVPHSGMERRLCHPWPYFFVFLFFKFFGFWYFFNKIKFCFHMWHVTWQNCLHNINPNRDGQLSLPLEMALRSLLSNIYVLL